MKYLLVFFWSIITLILLLFIVFDDIERIPIWKIAALFTSAALGLLSSIRLYAKKK